MTLRDIEVTEYNSLENKTASQENDACIQHARLYEGNGQVLSCIDNTQRYMNQLLRLLVLPLPSQSTNINPTSLRLLNNSPSLMGNRDINHLPIKRPSAPPRLRSLLIRNNNPHSPLSLQRIRPKDLIHNLHLRRMNTLFPIESQPAPISTLLLQHSRRRPILFLRLVRRTDEVNRRRQIRRPRSSCYRRPRE